LSAGYDDNNILVLDTIGIKFSPVFRDEQLLPIPDGPLANNSNLELPLNISGYSSGELITSSDDVVSCCVKMEHSFIGDLIMTLQCPNGQQALLKSKNGGGKYLGIPAGGDAHSQYDYSNSINPGTPGEGWNYCFSDKYTASNTTYNLLNNCNQVNGISMTNYSWNCYTCDSTHKFDTSNYFTPESSFTNLIGCPKNGEWKIIIMDDWAIDNGFVFSWDIEFSPDGSELYSYQVNVDTIIWDSPFISLQNSFSTIINPPFDSIGIYNTSISVIDEYGCVYDTNTSLNVISFKTKV
jgi:subtilisin-like proprotein convertase family protein